MISRRRVRLMTRLAICEKKQEKALRCAGAYFRSDYIGIHLMKSFFRMAAAFLLGAGLWVLLEMDFVVERLGVLDAAGIGMGMLICFGVLEGVYLLLTYLVFSVRYARAAKEREAYRQTLALLEREYARDGRRADPMEETKGESR